MSKNFNKCFKKQEEEKNLISNKLEYLETFKKEYENERIKKQSLETRAGLIVTLLGGIFIFLINDLKIFKNLFIIFETDTSLEKYLKFFISLSITLFLILTFYELVNILNINEYAAFYVEDNIDYTLKYSDTLDDLLLSYKEIIIIHRKINSRNAYSFSKAINYLVFLFIFIIIFLIMKGGK